MDHWTLKWGDLLQSNRKYLGDKGVWEFRDWIRDSIAANKPYDKLVRELLTAPRQFLRESGGQLSSASRATPKPTMEKTTQVFLGVRMVCAQCHDHPFEKLDAEPVLPDGGVLLGRRTARRATKSARRSSSISATTTR